MESPQQNTGRKDARIFSAEEGAAIQAQARAIQKKEMGKVRIFSQEEIAGFQQQEKAHKKTPEENKREEKRLRITSFLTDQVRSLRMDIQIANSRLSKMKRNPLMELQIPGVPRQPRATTEDIDQLENEAIGYTRESEALTEALHSFEQNKPLSDEAIKTLHAIEGRIASELSRGFEQKQQNPSTAISLEDHKRRLQLISGILNDLST